MAFVGLLDNHPYEIFTGVLDDDEGIILPKNVVSGHIIKNVDEHGNKRYDFQFENKRGYKVTIEGLSEKFNKEYWNYAKLISGVLRYRMPIEQVIKLVGSLQLDSENINTWKNGVERALKKYIQDGTEAKGKKCPNCGNETLVYQEGCLICKTCGAPAVDNPTASTKRLHRNLNDLDNGSCMIMRNNFYTCIIIAAIAISKSNII
mgnify:CR=1 FL=1